MKLHYFDQAEADQDDVLLSMSKAQGYVPARCLLGGSVVMSETMAGKNSCWGCTGPRAKCDGKPKQQ